MSTGKVITLDNSKKIKIFYHANCWDGFVAVLQAYNYYKDTGRLNQCDFVPVNYKDYFENLDDIVGCDIIILDFTFPREVMVELQNRCAAFVCLDHHDTAEKVMEGLPNCIFNMNLSGAGLAWNYFKIADEFCESDADWIRSLKHVDYNNSPRDMPLVVWLAQDYDLWCFLDKTRTRAFAIGRTALKQELTEENIENFSDSNIIDLLTKFHSASEYQQGVIDRIASTMRPVFVIVDGKEYKLNTVCCPDPALTSFVGEAIYEKYPDEIVAVYNMIGLHHAHFIISLRSAKEDVDCGALALKLNGGGHKRAAGFSVEKHVWMQVLTNNDLPYPFPIPTPKVN